MRRPPVAGKPHIQFGEYRFLGETVGRVLKDWTADYFRWYNAHVWLHAREKRLDQRYR